MSFFLSKFLWHILNPFNLFIFLNFIGIVLLLIKKNKTGFYLIFFNLFIISCVSFFPIGAFLIYKLEKNFHNSINIYPKEIDGILILGGATDPFLSNNYNQIIVNESAERLIESVNLINKYNKAKVIFSGGLGHAEVAKKFYNKMGVDLNKIIFEDKSRNTYENILFSKKILDLNKKENWILITSAFHMRRATLIGEKVNWIFYPFPVDFNQPLKIKLSPNLSLLSNLNSFQKGSHEWLGLIAYYLMDRTDKIY